jgi:hypothetical protein
MPTILLHLIDKGSCGTGSEHAPVARRWYGCMAPHIRTASGVQLPVRENRTIKGDGQLQFATIYLRDLMSDCGAIRLLSPGKNQCNSPLRAAKKRGTWYVRREPEARTAWSNGEG